MEVFICCASSDADFASHLALDLSQYGIGLWLDQGMPDQEVRKVVVEEGLARAEAFLLIVSARTFNAPDVAEQVASAQERGRRILILTRRGAAIPPEFVERLAGAARFDFTDSEIDLPQSAAYDESLAALLAALGIDPGEQTPSSPAPAVEIEAVESWLPGTWQAMFHNAKTNAGGFAEYVFEPDGRVAGSISMPQGAVTVSMKMTGQWRIARQRLTIQGQSTMALFPGQTLSYSLALKVLQVSPGLFKAITQLDDRVIFRKATPPSTG